MYLGLDLTSSGQRRTAAVVPHEELQLIAEGMLRSDEEMADFIGEHRPVMVVIDGPLAFRLGLRCLEENCSCTPLSKSEGRFREHELSRLGMGWYHTTRRPIIKKMVYRGIRLKDQLTSQGYEVIDICP